MTPRGEPRVRPSSPAAANLARDLFSTLAREEQRPRAVAFDLAFLVLFPSPITPAAPWLLLLVWGGGALLAAILGVLGGFQGIALLVLGPMTFAGYGTFTMLIERKDIARGWRALRALRHGEPALATWQHAEPTGLEVNDEAVVEHVFRFKTPDGKDHHVRARAFDDTRLRDQPEELVLYDPKDPDNAVVLGEIPGDPRPTSHGTLESVEGGASFGTLLAALLALTTWLLAYGVSIWALFAGARS